jgi:hypothetical protein
MKKIADWLTRWAARWLAKREWVPKAVPRLHENLERSRCPLRRSIYLRMILILKISFVNEKSIKRLVTAKL